MTDIYIRYVSIFIRDGNCHVQTRIPGTLKRLIHKNVISNLIYLFDFNLHCKERKTIFIHFTFPLRHL